MQVDFVSVSAENRSTVKSFFGYLFLFLAIYLSNNPTNINPVSMVFSGNISNTHALWGNILLIFVAVCISSYIFRSAHDTLRSIFSPIIVIALELLRVIILSLASSRELGTKSVGSELPSIISHNLNSFMAMFIYSLIFFMILRVNIKYQIISYAIFVTFQVIRTIISGYFPLIPFSEIRLYLTLAIIFIGIIFFRSKNDKDNIPVEKTKKFNNLMIWISAYLQSILLVLSVLIRLMEL
jgi:hypothetical protein